MLQLKATRWIHDHRSAYGGRWICTVHTRYIVNFHVRMHYFRRHQLRKKGDNLQFSLIATHQQIAEDVFEFH